MSEHVMLRDSGRHQLLCAVCKVRWPCTFKVHEILEKIKRQEEAKPYVDVDRRN